MASQQPLASQHGAAFPATVERRSTPRSAPGLAAGPIPLLGGNGGLAWSLSRTLRSPHSFTHHLPLTAPGNYGRRRHLATCVKQTRDPHPGRRGHVTPPPSGHVTPGRARPFSSPPLSPPLPLLSLSPPPLRPLSAPSPPPPPPPPLLLLPLLIPFSSPSHPKIIPPLLPLPTSALLPFPPPPFSMTAARRAMTNLRMREPPAGRSFRQRKLRMREVQAWALVPPAQTAHAWTFGPAVPQREKQPS